MSDADDRIAAAAAKYLAKIDRSAGDEGCWPWLGFLNSDGYGRLADGTTLPSGHARKVYAAPFGYKLLVGPIPEGMRVCHTCDTPACQNPRHWFLGTPGDNARDRAAKDRGNRPFGDRNPSHTHPHRVARGDRSGSRLHKGVHAGTRNGRALLTEAKVAEIRSRLASPDCVSRKQLAAEYGVTTSTLSNIAVGKTWRHVPSAV